MSASTENSNPRPTAAEVNAASASHDLAEAVAESQQAGAVPGRSPSAASPPVTPTRVPWLEVGVFILVAGGLGWLVCLPLWLSGEGLGDPVLTQICAMALMFTPLLATVAAVLLQRRRSRQTIPNIPRYLGLWPLHPVGRVLGVTGLAVLGTYLLVLAAAFVSAAFGWLSLDLATGRVDQEHAFWKLLLKSEGPEAKLDALMNILILLPFAVPPVVSSVGLLQLYGSGPLAMVGTPWILIGCYFTVALPFMYRAITNNLQAINLRDLMDASQLLGASTWQAAILVVLPNLRKGLMVALLLSFSFLFGEFVFANILVGTRYETLQVYLNNMRNSSGHFTSAVVISYFFFVLVLTWAATLLNKDKSQ